jgi:hypothetical protein
MFGNTLEYDAARTSEPAGRTGGAQSIETPSFGLKGCGEDGASATGQEDDQLEGETGVGAAGAQAAGLSPFDLLKLDRQCSESDRNETMCPDHMISFVAYSNR